MAEVNRIGHANVKTTIVRVLGRCRVVRVDSSWQIAEAMKVMKVDR